MSLDLYLYAFRETSVYEANITHNLGKMAAEAGLYEFLWRPEETDARHAEDLIAPLKEGLARLLADPARFKAFNPENGWGKYENLVAFVEKYITACEENPDARICASR